MKKPLHVLILEDRATDAEMTIRELRRAGFDPQWKRVETEAGFLAELKNAPDIILSDYSLPQFNGLEAARLLRESGLNIPFILISGTIGEDAAVEAMQHGATDYLLKDRIARLGIAVERALEQKHLRAAHRAADEAMRESETRMRLATEATGVGIWEWSLASHRVRWDAQMFRIYGVAPTADGFVEFGTWSGAVVPEDLPEQERLLQDVVRRRGSGAREFRIRRPGETECRTIEAVDTFRTDSTGKAEWVVGTNLDITGRKRAERELEQARDVAVEAVRIKSEFLANMSHEIRTPMNGIIGMTELVLGTELDRAQREYLTMVKSSARALLGLINDILDFSKIEAGKLEFESIPFSLRKCVGGMLKPLGLRAAQRGLTLTADSTAELPDHLLGDPLRLRQILINLIDNAIKFTERGGVTLRVQLDSATETEQSLHFSIADTGIGIPAEKEALIFEAFAQADGTATRPYGGTGLGLAIASQLVRRMGGRIWIEHPAEAGTTFHFTACFGLGPTPRLPEAVAHRPAAPVEMPRPGSSLRILLAEDNVINRALATAVLEDRGHSLTQAANGREAVEAAAREPFDLIFMDVQMPEMDGLEATRRIRESERATGRRTPISAMTAHAMADDRHRCLAAGMDHYISKPLNIPDLVALLARISADRNQTPAHHEADENSDLSSAPPAPGAAEIHATPA